MEAKHLQAVLPLRYSSHRQIVTANGGLACEVFSGSIGIEGADALQELIVRACNVHDDLVRRALDVLEGIEGFRLSGAMPIRVEKLRAALAAAGAA